MPSPKKILWVPLAIASAVVCLAMHSFVFPPPAKASGKPLYSLKQFESACAESFQKGGLASLRVRVAGQESLIRPLFDRLLQEISKKSSQPGGGQGVKPLQQLATALASLATELTKDPFPARQVKLQLSWSSLEHSHKLEADKLLDQAKEAFAQGRYGEINAPAQKAAGIYAGLNDKAGQGDALHLLARAKRLSADYPSATALLEKAGELARQDQDRLRQGQALVDLGDVLERQKNREQARRLYLQALKLLRPPADWQEATRALRQLGDLEVATGNFERAYQAYIQALGYAESVQDFLRMAQLRDYLGYCHRRLGDYYKAMEHHRHALRDASKIAQPNQRARARARALNHLGICSQKMAQESALVGDSDQTVKGLRKAIALEKEALANAVEAKDRWRQGYVLRALAHMHRELGKLLPKKQAALEYKRSLARAQEAHALAVEMQAREWEGLALHHWGLALARLGREQEGLATFAKAIALWERIGDLQSAAYAHLFVAQEFHEPNGKLPLALERYELARASFHKIDDQEAEACAAMDQARVYSAQGQGERAARLYERGIAALEAVRARAGLPEFKRAFLSKAYDRYQDAALFALDHDLPAQAFRYVESLKARTFLDQLAEGRVDLEKGIDPGLGKKRDSLEKRLSELKESLAQEYRKQPPDQRALNSLKTRQERLELDLDGVKKQIRMSNPLYASVRYPQPVAMGDFQRNTLASNEVFLEYFCSKKGVHCFLVTKDHIKTMKIADNSQVITRKIKWLLENVQQGILRGEGFDRSLASELYDLLLRPMEADLRGRELIIAPDGILASLPFEMLVMGQEGRHFYLLEKYRVKYVQSATVLTLLRNSVKRGALGQGFIGFGDPVYDYDSFKKGETEKENARPDRGGQSRLLRTRFARMAGGLARLDGTGREVRTIAGIFKQGKIKADIYLRASAREEQAKQQNMQDYGYIHFAMHGLVTPRLQAIAFSQLPGASEDGILTMGEIMNLRYAAELVALSACRTGLGRMVRGEGVIGLTRAVLYAGSRAALVSLWSVDDRGTSDLMTRFYGFIIGEGIDKVAALRRAKRQMLKTSLKHPFFWAAFVMYGE